MTLATAAQRYCAEEIEGKWQDIWRAAGLFATPDAKPTSVDSYVFVAPPFTSGTAHMGHVRSYSIGDAYARFRRAHGDSVLFSLGFDSFGLPAELGAIEHQRQPREWVEQCAAQMRTQFDRLGFSFDWSRTFLTCEPEMYRWSQWLFLALLDADLIYRAAGHVDWCESCQTVLAASQAEDGRCWRCHGELALVRREQWYLRLSAYNEENDRRLGEFSGIWGEAALSAQRTLLGRVDGVEFEGIALDGSNVTLFSSFPDRIGESAFVAVSPRHPDVERWLDEGAVRARFNRLRGVGLKRGDRKAEDVPVLTTSHVVRVAGVPHPLPVVITPMVDVRFGPTAVLGHPNADRTDRLIAERLPQRRPATNWKAKMRPLIKRPAVRFRASDFPISRQRAWGAPIPIIHCDNCGIVPVPCGELPVCLPEDLVVSGTGNALANDDAFLSCECVKCGRPARRETDTLDCHVDVFWIYMGATVPPEERSRCLFQSRELNRWLPVSQFIQGTDTGGFVLDERMVAKALRDLGEIDCLPDGEPYGPTLMHEMVLLDGRKMSKHLGNVVTPEEIVDAAGADALRFSILHAAAPSKRFNWDPTVLDYCNGFLERAWSFAEPRLREAASVEPQIETSTGMRRRLASWCRTAAERITENYEKLEMHRATRNLIVLLDRIEDFERRILGRDMELTSRDREAVRAALLLFLQMLMPIAPHLAEELWERAGGDGLLAEVRWPRRFAGAGE